MVAGNLGRVLEHQKTATLFRRAAGAQGRIRDHGRRPALPGRVSAPIARDGRHRAVDPVPDGTAAPRAAHASRPAMLPHEREALGASRQARTVDQVGCKHDGGGPSREPVGCPHSSHHTRYASTTPSGSPPWNPTRASSITAPQQSTYGKPSLPEVVVKVTISRRQLNPAKRETDEAGHSMTSTRSCSCPHTCSTLSRSQLQSHCVDRCRPAVVWEILSL